MNTKEILQASKILADHPSRPSNSQGRPGGLIDVSDYDGKTIVVGDIHGSIENLNAIVAHEGNDKDLSAKRTQMILVGDVVHNDQVGQMLEMESSLQTLERVVELILEFGHQIIYLRGNHDTFDERLAKSAIKQGLEFKKYITAQRGLEYLESVDRLFNGLPMFVIGNGFVVTHAGPVRNGATRQEIIDVHDNQDYYHQLMWNRLQEFRGGARSLKEYDEEDLRNMLRKMKLDEMTPFIVGHNPMWQTGNKTGIWRDIIGIKGHYILYCNIGTDGPYLLIHQGEITSKFAVTKKTQETWYVGKR